MHDKKCFPRYKNTIFFFLQISSISLRICLKSFLRYPELTALVVIRLFVMNNNGCEKPQVSKIVNHHFSWKVKNIFLKVGNTFFFGQRTFLLWYKKSISNILVKKKIIYIIYKTDIYFFIFIQHPAALYPSRARNFSSYFQLLQVD